MRKEGTARWGWLAVLGVMVAVGVAAAAGMPLPPDFGFPKSANSPAPVTFSHQKHADAKVTNCMDCHAPGKFQMKKGGTTGITMAAMNEGKVCGACHNGQRAFSVKDAATCTRCHKAE